MEQSVQSDHVADYLAELRPHLDDLDPSERAEVLDELADALREVAAENDGPLREVLGPPAEYVAAYRASAGLEHRPAPRRGRLRTFTDTVGRTLRAQPWWPRLSALGHLLRPAWWTLRGAVLAVLLGGMVLQVFPPSRVTSLPAIVCITAGVAASLAVGGGRRDGRAARSAVLAANLVAILATVMVADVAAQAEERGYSMGYDDALTAGGPAMEPGQLMMANGEVVTNIHPYTLAGEPLDDVLLFDGAGQPLNLVSAGAEAFGAGHQEIETAYDRDGDGQPITNLYPLEQYIVEYGDSGVVSRRPRTAPTIVLPSRLRADATAGPAAADSPTAAASEPAGDPPTPGTDAAE